VRRVLNLCYLNVIQCYAVIVNCSLCNILYTRIMHCTVMSYYKPPWLVSTNELYRSSDGRLSTKFVPTFAYRGCHVVSVTDPYVCTLNFLYRERYFFFQVALKLYSRGWEDSIAQGIEPGPLDL
jgi:hypothetical protein